MGRINREDMLELTRRMTVNRNCFHRIAGAYFDEEGYVDGTFNIHFQKLSRSDQEKNLKIAKTIPFSETNTALKEYRFPRTAKKPGSVWQFLKGILDSELKNDAMLDVFYEMFGGHYHHTQNFGIYFFLGNYDIPKKGSDKVRQWDSEEVYRFVICTVCPVHGEFEPELPECGFLFPAFRERSGDENYIDIFQADLHSDIMNILGIEKTES